MPVSRKAVVRAFSEAESGEGAARGGSSHDGAGPVVARAAKAKSAGKTKELSPSDAANASMLAHVRASGLKVTPQRIAIVREIASDPTHPTAQELYERLLPSMPTMSFATVYNTLDALAKAGLCAARALSPGPSRFDPNMIPHDHAVCDECGLVRDVASMGDHATGAGKAPGSTFGEAPIPGFSVHAVEQIYRGICAACEARRRSNKSPGRVADKKRHTHP